MDLKPVQVYDPETGTPSRVSPTGDLLVSLDGEDTSANYTTKIEYSGDNLLYVGLAIPGSVTSDTVWQIQKFTYVGTNLTDVKWADGVATFTKSWDDRATYPYS